MTLIDLQKEFDTVDHKILLLKMTCFCFKTSIIKQFGYHLSNRTFFVSVDGVFLEARSLDCGIPEGSILGPLLFSIDVYHLHVFIMVSPSQQKSKTQASRSAKRMYASLFRFPPSHSYTCDSYRIDWPRFLKEQNLIQQLLFLNT